MTPLQTKLAVAGGLALLAWLLTPRLGRVTREIEIDANVLSPTFGLPIGTDLNSPAAWNPELRRLVDESARRIREHDASDAASVQGLD
jgi:hypothetical protein